jgi:hypothetical protein
VSLKAQITELQVNHLRLQFHLIEVIDVLREVVRQTSRNSPESGAQKAANALDKLSGVAADINADLDPET